MLYYLSHFDYVWGPLRLFHYVTFRSVMALITALLWMFVIGPKIFKWLRNKKLRNVLRDKNEIRELANLHASKSQTVTMGGLAIVTGVLVSTILWAKYNCFATTALLAGLALACIGAIDDWQKISKKNSAGLKSYWKWLVQGIVVLTALYFLLSNPAISNKIDSLHVTFLKTPLLENLPPILLFLFWFVVFSGTSNAINLTDGIDGLAIGCTITVTLTYTIFAYITGNILLSSYLHVTYLNGVEELCILCSSILGASIGFLWFNAHPAEVFMGDTGSLALGAWIGTVALMTNQAITLIIVGFVFVIEALSVILQVASFKLFKKRIFKMSPIHHHFELNNIHESKIIVRFWIISLLCALFGLFTLKLR